MGYTIFFVFHKLEIIVFCLTPRIQTCNFHSPVFIGFVVNLIGIFIFQHGGAGHGHSHGGGDSHGHSHGKETAQNNHHGHSHDGGHSHDHGHHHGHSHDGSDSQIMKGVSKRT